MPARRRPSLQVVLFIPIGLAVIVPLTSLHSVTTLRVLLLPPLLLVALKGAPTYAWRYFSRGSIGLFVIVMGASIFWSENRWQTALSLGSWALEMLAALAALALGVDRSLRYIARSLKLLLVSSAALALLVPTVGRMDVAGAPWQGLFVHKNALGTVAAFAVVVLAATGRPSHRARWVIGGLVVLVASQSVGGLVAALAGLLVQALARVVYTQRSHGRVWPASVFYGALVVGCGVIWSLSERLLDLVNRASDLTGRTTVWGVVGEYGSRHWATGTGLGAQIYDGSALQRQIETARGVALGTTHNGLLTVYLGMGVVGMLLLGLALGRVLLTIERARRQAATSTDAVLLALGLFTCYVTANISGDLLLTRGGWFFLSFGVLQLLARAGGRRPAGWKQLAPAVGAP